MQEIVVTVDGRSEGRMFEGVGALSAGASSRMLPDYPEPYRSDILDYLFKPNFGANLHHLKVEIGGDVNSTLGSEPSHAVSWEEFRNPRPEYFQRGYEWWLMKEARKRNPDIILEALQWGAPGWIGQTEGREWPMPQWTGVGDFYTPDNAEFIAAFHLAAKQYYNLEIDYQGIRNEIPYDIEWIKLLRKTLDKHGLHRVRIDAGDQPCPEVHWRIAEDMARDPELLRAVAVLNCHTAEDVNFHTSAVARSLNKPLWNGEGHAYGGDWYAAANHARFNRAYPLGRITKTITWSLISAHPDTWMRGSGMMQADQPWSGHYDLQPPLWMIAHTNQFARPGWKYLDSGCRFFGGDGGVREGWSITTLKAPDSDDYSIVIETMDAKEPQQARFKVSKDLSPKDLAVWRSVFKQELFVQQPDVRVENGEFSLALVPSAIYSLTTTRGQQKGAPAHAIPAIQPFPLPFAEDFERAALASPARYFCDHHGTFEVVARSDGNGQCLRQAMTQQGIQWGDRMAHPLTVGGDANWQDYRLAVDIMRPKEILLNYMHAVTVWGRLSRFAGDLHWAGPLDYPTPYSAYCLQLMDDGAWSLVLEPQRRVLASGKGAPLGNAWHHVTMSFAGDVIAIGMDDRELARVKDGSLASGMVGLGTGWNQACFDNLRISPLGTTREEGNK